MKKRRPHPLIETASAYLGYTSREQNNVFAISTGYTGTFQWDGSFVDRVLKDAGYNGVPSHANTVTALSYYIRKGLQRRAPKPGDIVFYSFSAPGGTATFDPPHIGIVTDVSRWKTDSSFKAIEAQVSSGQPKGPSEENGVYERTRYATDVLTFTRLPASSRRPKVDAATSQKKEMTGLIQVSPAHINRCLTGNQASTAKPELRKRVEAVQLALAAVPGINFRNADRGVFNLKSQSAFAAFQRQLGVPAERCDGIPTLDQLDRLARVTNMQFFRADG